jgi:hypothetical protein
LIKKEFGGTDLLGMDYRTACEGLLCSFDLSGVQDLARIHEQHIFCFESNQGEGFLFSANKLNPRGFTVPAAMHDSTDVATTR